MTALKFLIEADDGKVADAAAWRELVADLESRPRRRRGRLVVAVVAVAVAFAAGYLAAPDAEPAPAPVVVVCQEQDPAACVEMPAVR